MKRWLINLATVLSLILFLGTVTFWVRGYYSDAHFDYRITRRMDEGWGNWAEWRLGGHTARGSVIISWSYYRYIIDPPTQEEAQRLSNRDESHFYAWISESPRPLPIAGATFAFGGFGYRPDASWGSIEAHTIWFPYWLPALATAVLPALRVRKWLNRRRENRAGRCRKCGYDLRATPERCPECGSVAEQVNPHTHANDRPDVHL